MQEELKSESTDLLSPSETVKIRKTSRQLKLEVNELNNKEVKTLRKPKSTRVITTDKMVRDSDKNFKKDKKDDKNKDIYFGKNKKADKESESKRSLLLKEKRKSMAKKVGNCYFWELASPLIKFS